MNDVYSLSYHATLMSKDIPVGDIHGRTVTPLREELLPIYFQRGGDFAQWLSMRAIDATRTNSRLLKKVLRLQERDDVSTALHFNAVTITDTYWVRPDGTMCAFGKTILTHWPCGVIYLPSAGSPAAHQSLPTSAASRSAGGLRTASGGCINRQRRCSGFLNCLFIIFPMHFIFHVRNMNRRANTSARWISPKAN